MSYETVVLEKKPEDGIGIITLNRPQVLNAMSSKLKKELNEAIRDVGRDDKIRALIIKGAGRAFCAGQDLKEASSFGKKKGTAEKWMEKGELLYTVISELGKPYIAAIHGYACGYGFQLALLADIRIAAEDAKMAMTEINVGLPCVFGSWVMIKRASPMVARELTLTGDFIDAKRAERVGLVNMVVPKDKLMSTAMEMAKKLAKKPAVTMRLQKKWLDEYDGREYEYVYKRGLEIHDENFIAGESQNIMESFFKKKEGRLTRPT